LILVPQAVMGIAAVLLTYDLVRRRFRRWSCRRPSGDSQRALRRVGDAADVTAVPQLPVTTLRRGG
jgi:hypothetical protein